MAVEISPDGKITIRNAHSNKQITCKNLEELDPYDPYVRAVVAAARKTLRSRNKFDPDQVPFPDDLRDKTNSWAWRMHVSEAMRSFGDLHGSRGHSWGVEQVLTACPRIRAKAHKINL